MKLRNRILSVLLVACMLVTLLPVSAAAIGVDTGLQAQENNTAAEAAADPITTDPRVFTAETEDSVDEALAEALEAMEPEQAGPVTVTVEKLENPGLDLKLDSQTLQTSQVVESAPYGAEETVRVIVVLEDRGLLEQGFTTNQIASNTGSVKRQVNTMAKRQENVLQSINQIVEEPVEAKYRYSVVLNGMALEIPYGDLEEIRELPGVKTAFVAPQYSVPEDMTGETVASPAMYATGGTVGSTQTWKELGYTGQGMRIAILDSGLDDDHPSFAAAPELTENSLTLSEVEKVMSSLNAYKLYMGIGATELTADRLYRSEKVPFGFNYVDRNLELNNDNPSAYDHGTHVAGIAAANPVEGTDVVGVAPDAQVLVMKLFGVAGGAYTDDILAALEDCFRLNVDVVNMSLGSAAGFTDESEYLTEIYGRILESDMIVAISAGNSYSAAFNNIYGTHRNLTEDPDIGIVSSPATYVGGTMVASVENISVMCNYFTVGEEDIPYADVGAKKFSSLGGKELPYVMVPGYGTVEDFSKVDVTGKIAVVSRGSYDPDFPVAFADKQKNASDAGAIAIVVYDNVEGAFINMVDAGLIPNVFVTKASGQILADNAVDGQGVLCPQEDKIPADSAMGGQMSDFSSWGVTPDLKLAPDVTAPGGNIYSTRDGGIYGTMSGTSMAAPHIAGMGALVLEFLRENYPELSDAETHTVAESLLMSTAEPVVEPTGVLYSPRKQGSGSANVYKAITSPTYLTVDGTTPKISFGDDDNRTGVYRFNFEVNNLTDKAQAYALDGAALTDQVDLSYAADGYTFMGEASRDLTAKVSFSLKNGQLSKQYDYNGDGETDMADVQALLDAVNGLAQVKSGYDLTGDRKVDTADAQALYVLVSGDFTPLDVVEVPANGSVRVYVTQVGHLDGNLVSMAMNYADGFMYGVQRVTVSPWEFHDYLVQINLGTAKMRQLFELDAETFGTSCGSLAVDYDGNFYVCAIPTTGGVDMVKFRLENGEAVNLQKAHMSDTNLVTPLPKVFPHGLFRREPGHLLCLCGQAAAVGGCLQYGQSGGHGIG